MLHLFSYKYLVWTTCLSLGRVSSGAELEITRASRKSKDRYLPPTLEDIFAFHPASVTAGVCVALTCKNEPD